MAFAPWPTKQDNKFEAERGVNPVPACTTGAQFRNEISGTRQYLCDQLVAQCGYNLACLAAWPAWIP